MQLILLRYQKLAYRLFVTTKRHFTEQKIGKFMKEHQHANKKFDNHLLNQYPHPCIDALIFCKNSSISGLQTVSCPILKYALCE